ncbi:unnamed protein product [Jaminaea pallidilutea]
MSGTGSPDTDPTLKQATSDSSSGSGQSRQDLSHEHNQPWYSRQEERRLVRKVDLLLVPTLSILYLLSFLDRSNIGNAKIDGMATDLRLGSQYSTSLTLFFVGYVISELPANWGLKATSPPFWMPLITFVFGLVSLCQGLVHNKEGLLAVRFFLGVAEAGLFPGTVFIFSQWYKRKERVVRVTFFFGAAAAAGAFGGVLAYAIGLMDGVGGKRGWEWIFILEGLLTMVIAGIAFFTIPNLPAKTKWLSERESAIVKDRLMRDSDALELEGRFNWSGVRQAIKDPKVYLYSSLFHGFSFGLYTISLFLPTIIQGLGYGSWQAQLLSVPPYVLAFLAVMTIAWISQRVGIRAPFIIGSALVAIVGYIVLLTSPTIGGKYVSTFLIVGGIYSGNGILLAWPSENVAGATKRNTALAMQISLGNIGAIIGTQLYRMPLGSLPNANYHISIGLTILWLGIGILSASALWLVLGRENRRRDEAQSDSKEKGGLHADQDPEEVARLWAELGDRRPDFRYQL